MVCALSWVAKRAWRPPPELTESEPLSLHTEQYMSPSVYDASHCETYFAHYYDSSFAYRANSKAQYAAPQSSTAGDHSLRRTSWPMLKFCKRI